MKLWQLALAGLGTLGLMALFSREATQGGNVPHNMEDWLPLIQASTKGSPIKASVYAAIVENESGGDPNATRFEYFDPSKPKKPKDLRYSGGKVDGGSIQRHEKNHAGQTVPLQSTGLNQFLISTGESYGLRSTIESSTDERRDPTKSIPAGVLFLLAQLRALGSEDGMIAAYNLGAGGAKSYRKTNGSFAGQPYLEHIRAKQQKYLHLDA